MSSGKALLPLADQSFYAWNIEMNEITKPKEWGIFHITMNQTLIAWKVRQRPTKLLRASNILTKLTSLDKLGFPDSLCDRIMKAKCYPGVDLLDTAFIQNASPKWQGIMHGLELLKKGFVWRICDGRTVCLWRDNWIPRRNLKINISPTTSGWQT